MDYFLDDENFYRRLKEHYRKYGKLIILYDFDNTVYPRIGSCYDVIELLRRWKEHACLICYTARPDEDMDFVECFLKQNAIPYDYINRDEEGNIPMNGRKIHGDIMLDDKCGMSVAYKCLCKLIKKIEQGKI